MPRSIVFLFFLIMFIAPKILPQEVDISSALQDVEKGNFNNAEAQLADLKLKSPNDPSVIFLDAVLTKDGEEAVRKYTILLEKYPDSKYLDAALFRVFSYYYALGYYKKAETYLDRLKKDFPESPFITAADRKIPDVEDAPPVKPEVKPRSVEQQERTEAKSFNFTIQAGAFLIIDNAKSLVEKLRKENLYTEISTREIGGSILNVVTVGKFETEAEARPVLNHIEKDFNIKGRVVPIRK
jgi:tetratricopeptide (TPR) repeat protein